MEKGNAGMHEGFSSALIELSKYLISTIFFFFNSELQWFWAGFGSLSDLHKTHN
jgi:hypothetical protein